MWKYIPLRGPRLQSRLQKIFIEEWNLFPELREIF